jgi:uncharacterized surface protein with fasciclin (FAS1) repeats
MFYLSSIAEKLAIAGIVGLSFVPAVLAIPESKQAIAQITSPATVPEAIDASDIVAVASAINEFSVLEAAINTTGLADELSASGPFTVFAPTNEAFAELDETLTSQYGISVDVLFEPENQELLAAVLANHVVPAVAVDSGDIPNGTTTLEAANGTPLQINRDGRDVNVNSVDITAFDVMTSNGIIHAIDQVLLPPEVVAALQADGTLPSSPASTNQPIRGLW